MSAGMMGSQTDIFKLEDLVVLYLQISLCGETELQDWILLSFYEDSKGVLNFVLILFLHQDSSKYKI